MALGAIEAIDAAKRLKEIKVAGFDGNNDAIKSISEGRLMITGAQRPDAQAYWSVLADLHVPGGIPGSKRNLCSMSSGRQEQCRGVSEEDQKVKDLIAGHGQGWHGDRDTFADMMRY